MSPKKKRKKDATISILRCKKAFSIPSWKRKRPLRETVDPCPSQP